MVIPIVAAKKQRCLHPWVFRRVLNTESSTPLQLALSEGIVGACFFAMRSCEFSLAASEHKTVTVALGCVRFMRRDNLTASQFSDEILVAFAISVSFVGQKNDVKMDRTTNENTNGSTMNPASMFGRIVHRLRTHPGDTDRTPTCTCVEADESLRTFKQGLVLHHLRSVAAAIGEDHLGFGPNEIGTRSIRTSAAIGWFLANKPIPMMQLMGRWTLSAWLTYVHKAERVFHRSSFSVRF